MSGKYVNLEERMAGTVQTEHTPWYVLNSPELGRPFQEFYNACT